MKGRFEPYVFPEYAEFIMVNYYKRVPEIWPETSYFKWICQGCSDGGRLYRGVPIDDSTRLIDLLHNDCKIFETIRSGDLLQSIHIWGLTPEFERNRFCFYLDGYHRLTAYQVLCVAEVKVALIGGEHK